MKNIVIFGDSYSTFWNCIPEGYATFYSPDDLDYADVNKKEQTWWWLFAAETGVNIVRNDSWSGSTIGYTGYENTDCSRTSSFIKRFRDLLAQDFFNKNKIDGAIVFGGTNDSWAGAPVGKLKYSDWEEKDLYEVLPAVCYLMNAVKAQFGGKNTVFLVNSELNPEIEEGICEAARHYGVIAVKVGNIEKMNCHPTKKGMAEISRKLIAALSD